MVSKGAYILTTVMIVYDTRRWSCWMIVGSPGLAHSAFAKFESPGRGRFQPPSMSAYTLIVLHAPRSPEF